LLGDPIKADAHHHALQLLAAAIAMAERTQMRECERTPRRADEVLRDTSDDVDGAEAIVAEAMAQL
jgi:hypothetical protein